MGAMPNILNGEILMSDNKKYYYLKLKDNFFDSDEIVILESMPDGYKYSNILLKLYLRSLKNEGKLMFNSRIPFNSQMLATITRHSVGDVEKAVDVFKQLGLIEVLDNGAIYMLDIQNFVGQSSTEADRVRNYRKKIANDKKPQISVDDDGVQMYDKSTPEIELEIELEKEIEQEKENEGGGGEELDELSLIFEKPKAQKVLDTEIGSVFEYYQASISPNLGPQAQSSILNWWQSLTEYTTPKDAAEIINWAIDESVNANKPSIGYVNTVITRSVLPKKVETAVKAKELADEFRAKRQSAKQQSKTYSNKPRIIETKPTYEQPKQETEVTDEQVARTKQMIEQMKLNRHKN